MGPVTKQFYVHNNVKLAALEEGRCRYAFVDSQEHCADRILMGSLIPTRFEPQGEAAQYGDFEIRVCSFKERYESWFLCCMSDLEWVLQVEGNYVGACEELLGAPAILSSERRKLADQTTRDKVRDLLPHVVPVI